MALFRYEAVDKTGKVVRGAMNASDEQQVAQNLATMGYMLRGIHGGGDPSATVAPSARQVTRQRPPGIQAVTSVAGVPVSVRSCVPVPALAAFFRQLATLVKSGMSVYQALGEMPMMVRNRRLRETLSTLQEAAQSGRPLSGTMASFPRIYPVHAIASVWAGELSGRLEVALEEVAADLELEASEIRYGRIGWGITKIHIVSLVVLIPLSNLVSLLLPALAETLKQGERVSWVQVVGYVIRNYMRSMFWQSLAVSVLLVSFWIGWGHVKRVPTMKRFLDGLLLRAPIWGPLHRDRALARFLHVMDGLYAAGLTPGQAWDAASLTVRNSALAESLRLARTKVPVDAGPSDMFEASGVFDPEEVAMARSGEKTGQVPAVLANMSAIYADKAAAAKTRNRVMSIAMMNAFFGVLVIIVWFRIVNSYCALAEKAAELVGKP